MNYFVSAILIVLIIVCIIAASSHDIAPFTVIRHHDGDTTTVKDSQGNQFNIRYHVIDANEIKQSGGVEARDYLYSLLPVGSKISIAFTGNKSHDRSIGTVYRKGENINLAMLKAGHAVIDRRYLKQIDRELQNSYLDHEANAKRYKKGRWGNSKWCAQTPWEFRAKKK